MSKELFNRVYDLLVAKGGAEDTPRRRGLFLEDHACVFPAEDDETEFRFCGKLEMGGKFRCRPRDGFFVECYPESLQRRPELGALIDEINKDLKPMYREWRASTSPDMQAALATLRAAGILAFPSRLEPGGIQGGLSVVDVGHGVKLHEYGFIILVEPEGYLASVPGPGNGSHDVPCPTLTAGAEAVVEEYRRRKWIG